MTKFVRLLVAAIVVALPVIAAAPARAQGAGEAAPAKEQAGLVLADHHASKSPARRDEGRHREREEAEEQQPGMVRAMTREEAEQVLSGVQGADEV